MQHVIYQALKDLELYTWELVLPGLCSKYMGTTDDKRGSHRGISIFRISKLRTLSAFIKLSFTNYLPYTVLEQRSER